jgi:hypothetical protein
MAACAVRPLVRLSRLADGLRLRSRRPDPDASFRRCFLAEKRFARRARTPPCSSLATTAVHPPTQPAACLVSVTIKFIFARKFQSAAVFNPERAALAGQSGGPGRSRRPIVADRNAPPSFCLSADDARCLAGRVKKTAQHGAPSVGLTKRPDFCATKSASTDDLAESRNLGRATAHRLPPPPADTKTSRAVAIARSKCCFRRLRIRRVSAVFRPSADQRRSSHEWIGQGDWRRPLLPEKTAVCAEQTPTTPLD